MVTLEHLKEFHPEVEVYSSDSLWLDREVTCFALSRITTRRFIMILFSFSFVAQIQSRKDIFNQATHIFCSSLVITFFLYFFPSFFISFSFLPSVCGLIDYIFLTLYLGGKWVGNLQHPLRGYFIIMDPEKNSQKLCMYMCLFIVERLVGMDPEKNSQKLCTYMCLFIMEWLVGMDPEKNSQKLCTYMCLFIVERLVAMDPEKNSKKVLQIFANLFPIFHTKI